MSTTAIGYTAWIALYGSVNFLDYGGTPDGTTDNSAAFTTALATRGTVGLLCIPPGLYNFTSAIPSIPGTIDLLDSGAILLLNGVPQQRLSYYHPAGTAYNVLTETFASGSSTTTTGSMGASGTTVTLANADDFALGQNIAVENAGALAVPSTLAVSSESGSNAGVSSTFTATDVVLVAASYVDPSGNVTPASTAISTTIGTADYVLKATITLNPWAASTRFYVYTGNTQYALCDIDPRGAVTYLGTSTTGVAVWIVGGQIIAFIYDTASSTGPTPPSTNSTVGPLLTQITAGGGTTSLTVADEAVYAVAGVMVAHDDAPAINAALNVARSGQRVFLPGPGANGQSGAAYQIWQTIYLGPNSSALVGEGTRNFVGGSGSDAQWAGSGTWIQPNHTGAPAISVNGEAPCVEGINFLWSQPTPGSGAYTPTTYSYAISCGQGLFNFSNLFMLNPSHGISFEFDPDHGGGGHGSLHEVAISPFDVAIHVNGCNDIFHVQNVHVSPFWQYDNSNVLNYIEANAIGFDVWYWDNADIRGYACRQLLAGFKFTDSTTLGNTHSMWNAKLGEVDWNQVAHAMDVASSTTHVKFMCGTSQSYGLNSDTLFKLTSDNVYAMFGDHRCETTGGQFMEIGGDTSGRVQFGSLDIEAYSATTGNLACFSMNAGSVLVLPTNKRITKPNGAGAIIAGSGYGGVYGSTYSWVLWGSGNSASGTTNGSWQDFTWGNRADPYGLGAVQARVSGQIDIGTAVTGGTFGIRLANLPEIVVTGISGAATGYAAFDTGWLDITTADSTPGNLEIGRVQINGTTGIAWTSGTLAVEFR